MIKRGIFLVANLKSQDLCANLIHSIRETDCRLPIRLVHFGGKKIRSSYILNQVEFLEAEDFPAEAIEFVAALQSVLSCPKGFLFRFLPWFSDWDEFIYSDNDIVALTNWDQVLDHLSGFDLVHADREYTTRGQFNYEQPDFINEYFGAGALDSAFTAGHFAARRNLRLITDMRKAIKWFSDHPGIPKNHDQALLHVAALIGSWKLLNLCKPPYNWLSTWAGDYRNSLELIQEIQHARSARTVSHIHYSGGTPHGNLPIEELLFSNLGCRKRSGKLFTVNFLKLSGYLYLASKKKRALQKLRAFI